MADFSNPEDVNLQELKDRIMSTDLIPSRVALLDDIDNRFDSIAQKGVNTWAELSKVLKNPTALDSFAKLTCIDAQYLTLLKREVESYLQKPFSLKEITWVPSIVIEKLVEMGISNSASLYKKVKEKEGVQILVKQTGIDQTQLQYLLQLADLTRIQWVSPNTARMLIEAGYENSKKVALADPDELCEGLDRINVGGKYFRGKIGLRDVKRLIQASTFVT